MLFGIFRTLRPHQWVKNVFVLAPLVFSRHLGEHGITLRAVAAMLVFCLLSGSVYAINDVLDAEKDRAHPTKRNRPVASGKVPPRVASAVAVGLIAVSIGGAAVLGVGFSIVASAYLLLNLAYSAYLKEVVFVDVLIIASGFVLRVLGGSLASDVRASSWLLACTFLLALFLALGKRAHELRTAGEKAGERRPVLLRYSAGAIRALMAATGLATLGAYAAYTLAPHTREFFGTSLLVLTTPFPALGLARFWWLVRRPHGGESPTDAMLRDPLVLVSGVLYGAAILGILYLA
ncbi:MAG: decaprenyl-phosphate phosphoribosyltransferase [Deltaproteobacteria bacterium]|nr:decaprenyl-phosphate phosphoribosyltransferase [Deltaproteobacteria bacterium]